MSETAAPQSHPSLLNVPNQVTMSRIVLSVLLFAFLAFGWYQTSFALFLVTAFTDWIDGYWARKYGQITKLGRVLDPFADKLFICGVFILLAAVPKLTDGTNLPRAFLPGWQSSLLVENSW